MSILTYDVVYCDPPWHYNSRKAGAERLNKTKFGGGAEKHYQLMRDEELLEMRSMIDSLARENSVIFMWATCPKLQSALTLLTGWGYRYCTVAFVWEKVNRTNGEPIFNPGYYTASNVELVLLGARGSMRPERPMIQQVVKAPRREHSRKPDEVRVRIEQMYPCANRVELFARGQLEGWDAWGLELPGMVKGAIA